MPSFASPPQTITTPVPMPAAVSAKPQQVGKENFAIRGLQFCGLIKRHAAPASRIKPLSTSHNAETAGRFSKSANDLLDNALLVPPPPYRHARPSSSSASFTSGSDGGAAAAAATRRTRRLSKPPPSTNQEFHYYAHAPSSPLAKSFPTSALPTSSLPMNKSKSTPPSTTTTATKEKVARTSSSLDSSGRLRPPVSGVRTKPSRLAPPKQSADSKDTTTHTYHYKRARTVSGVDASRRAQEAVLCLEALLDACDSGAVKDMRHVTEQVALARKILIGDDGIGLVKLIRDNGAENAGTGPGNSSLKVGASTSVTSLATLSNLAT